MGELHCVLQTAASTAPSAAVLHTSCSLFPRALATGADSAGLLVLLPLILSDCKAESKGRKQENEVCPHAPKSIRDLLPCASASSYRLPLLTLCLARLRTCCPPTSALGFASGVLLYVSLVDIFATETLGHFTSAGNSNAQATAFATLCFFGGMPIAYGERMKGPEHSSSQQCTSCHLVPCA